MCDGYHHACACAHEFRRYEYGHAHGLLSLQISSISMINSAVRKDGVTASFSTIQDISTPIKGAAA